VRQIHDHADVILLRTHRPQDAAVRFPDHVIAATITRDDADMLILRRRTGSTTPYRLLYAEAFLHARAARSSTDDVELNTLCYEWVKARVLSRREVDAVALLRKLPPSFQPGHERRPIYWLGGSVWTSAALSHHAYAQLLEAAAHAPPRPRVTADRPNAAGPAFDEGDD
jgi:hypothetical protein